jgi:hypothetical protein
VFALLAAHREPHSFETGAQDGFKRYQAHLTRALASTRKALAVSGKGKPDLTKVEGDPRSVSLLSSLSFDSAPVEGSPGC